MSKLVCNFEPFGDWVLLECIPPGETAGGIALPDGASIGHPRAKVLEAGPGKMCEYDGKTMPMSVRVGDVVYMLPVGPGNATAFTEDGKDYVVMRAHHLVGKTRR
jgi:co-chaperonin GroES (HSP10)